jgi:hypothetical protein
MFATSWTLVVGAASCGTAGAGSDAGRSTSDSGTCVPGCGNAVCGSDDGCGGTCQPGSGCTVPDGGCAPSCTGISCGAANGCGGTCAPGSGCNVPDGGGGGTNDAGSADNAFFVAKYALQIEALRAYLMTEYATTTIGLIPKGKFPNGSVCGVDAGSHPGCVLVDNNIMIGTPLDYLNAQKGITTHINGTVRSLLSQTWVGIGDCAGTTQTYAPFSDSSHGIDRREILFGNASPYFTDLSQYAVWEGGTQQWVLPGSPDPFSSVDGVITELPNAPQASPQSSPNTTSLEGYCPYTELEYLKGNQSQADSLYMAVVASWNGSYFVGFADSATALNPRDASYFIHMTRALNEINGGNWSVPVQTQGGSMTLETLVSTVITNLMKQQTSGSFGAPESNGQVLLAFDARVPDWFGHP